MRKKWISIAAWAWLYSALSVSVSSGAKDLQVIKDLVRVSAPGKDGFVAITGAAKTVTVNPNMIARYTVENTKTKEQVQGVVNRDGSFATRIKAVPGNKIKATFVCSSGKKEKVSRKVPQFTAHILPEGASSNAVREFQGETAGSPRDIVIRYSEVCSADGAGKPLDPDEEVKQSGVLPPD